MTDSHLTPERLGSVLLAIANTAHRSTHMMYVVPHALRLQSSLPAAQAQKIAHELDRLHRRYAAVNACGQLLLDHAGGGSVTEAQVYALISPRDPASASYVAMLTREEYAEPLSLAVDLLRALIDPAQTHQRRYAKLDAIEAHLVGQLPTPDANATLVLTNTMVFARGAMLWNGDPLLRDVLPAWALSPDALSLNQVSLCHAALHGLAIAEATAALPGNLAWRTPALAYLRSLLNVFGEDQGALQEWRAYLHATFSSKQRPRPLE